MHAVDEPSRRVREPGCTKTGKDCNRQNRQREWQPGPTRAARIVSYRSWTGERQDRNEGQAPNSEHRCNLRQRQWACQRIAERVPGKTCEGVAAQPFDKGQRYSQSEQAPPVRQPERPRQRQAKPSVDSKHRRKPDDCKRQQPAEGRRIDQESEADPIKPSEKIAESEPPADRRSRDHRVPATAADTVNEPDQDRECQKQHRPSVERRHRRGRHRAGDERDRAAPPAPRQNDTVGKTGELHGVRGGFAPGRPVSSRGGTGLTIGARTGTVASRAVGERRSLRRYILTRLTRRGSASSTSASNGSGPGTNSPRTGTWPALVTR